MAVTTGSKGRIVRRNELQRFRQLGEAWARADVDADDMVTALDGAGDVILDVMINCARKFDDVWAAHEIDQTIVVLCGCVETLTRYAYDELIAGYFPQGVGPLPLAA